MDKQIIGFDAEGSGLDIGSAKMASFQVFYPDSEERDFVPVNMKGANDQETWNEAKRVIENIAKNFKVVVFNGAYDVALAYSEFGVKLDVEADSMLYFLQTPETLTIPSNQYGLKPLAEYYNLAGQVGLTFEEVCPGLDFTKIDVNDERAREYANADPELAWRLWDLLSKKHPQNLKSHRLECDALPEFAAMTVRGIPIDTEQLPNIDMQLQSDLAMANAKVGELAGMSIRANSNKDLEMLWEHLGWELPPKTSQKENARPSFKEENLEKYLPSTLVQQILDTRKLIWLAPRVSKIMSESVQNGKLHPWYKQIGPSGGGRVYTEKPSTNGLAKPIRNICPAPEGTRYVYADWKQAEYVLALQTAGEQNLTNQYFDGYDVMRVTAANRFNVSLDEVTENERDIMKVVLYASMYGSEGISVARALKAGEADGRNEVSAFWDSVPRLRDLRDEIHQRYEECGYTESPTGFKRFLPVYPGHNAGGRRQAFNSAFQSGVACLFKMAIVRASKILPEGIVPVTGVFDSFLFQVDNNITLEEVQALMEEISYFEVESEWYGSKQIRFMFSLAEGKTWGEAQDAA